MKIRCAAAVIILFLLPVCASAQTPPVKLDTSLSAIVNLKDFAEGIEYYSHHYAYSSSKAEETFDFTPTQRLKLAENGFVVTPDDAEQFFQIYESHHFGIAPRIPNFITSDCMLQLYHLFFDFTLRAVESGELLPELESLSEGMLKASQGQAAQIADPDLKRAAEMNAQFFEVAVRLLGKDKDLPPLNAESPVAVELNRIQTHSGMASSEINGIGHDYSQYAVRGHYTRSGDLTRFFKSMMWYGLSGFPFKVRDQRTPQQVKQALLMTRALFEPTADGDTLITHWDKIYSITTSYVGAADDLTPYQYRQMMEKVYGKNAPLAEIAKPSKLDEFYRVAEATQQPKIQPQSNQIATGLQFRLMGQRYLPDSEMLQRLTSWPERPWPRGLDVFAVMGSAEAAYILDSLYHESQSWDQYIPIRNALTKQFGQWSEANWSASLYTGWIYALKILVDERGTEYPYFLQNQAWARKQLTTGLASWSEARHDVILYGKSSMAEGGDGEPPRPRPLGYVEPVPKFWGQLQKLIQQTRTTLEGHDALSDVMKDLFDRYGDMLSFLKSVSEKELREEMLSDKELERIQFFGGDLENLSLAILETGLNQGFIDPYTGEKISAGQTHLDAWFEVQGPDRDVACIADVHTSQDSCLEEAVGHLDQIYVAVPIQGKLYMTRGGVFSHYEFKYPYSHRLNDEAWQEMIKRGRAPDRAEWNSSYVTP